MTPNERAAELHNLLHRLWSKAGTTAYDKQEWKRLEFLIQDVQPYQVCPTHGPCVTCPCDKVDYVLKSLADARRPP